MTQLSPQNTTDIFPFGSHLMGKTTEEILTLLGPPAKKYKGTQEGYQEWYYVQPRKAKLYFKNGKLNWWNLTIDTEKLANSNKQKNKTQRHPRLTSHADIE